MNQRIWGKYGWYTIHSLYALESADRHQPDIHYALFHHLGKILPCAKCRKCYEVNKSVIDQCYIDPKCTRMRKYNIGINRALFEIHNIVNEKTGKPQYSWETFLIDSERMKSQFHKEFVFACMVFCQVIAYVHDHMPQEIEQADIQQFLSLLFQAIHHAYTELDASNGTYARMLARHGLEVTQQISSAHPMQHFIHLIFDPFTKGQPARSILMDMAYPNQLLWTPMNTQANIEQIKVAQAQKIKWLF